MESHRVIKETNSQSAKSEQTKTDRQGPTHRFLYFIHIRLVPITTLANVTGTIGLNSITRFFLFLQYFGN